MAAFDSSMAELAAAVQSLARAKTPILAFAMLEAYRKRAKMGDELKFPSSVSSVDDITNMLSFRVYDQRACFFLVSSERWTRSWAQQYMSGLLVFLCCLRRF